MDIFFIFKFALKNLALHRLRSILTIMGMVIGVSAIVFLLSFAYGIQRLVTNEVTTGDAFLLIDVGTGNSEIVTLGNAESSKIEQLEHVDGLYSMAAIGAKAEKNGTTVDMSFYGIHSEYVAKSSIHVQRGVQLSGKGAELLVNQTFADFWKVEDKDNLLGAEVNLDLVIPKDMIGAAENLDLTAQKFKIVGIIDDTSTPKAYTNIAVLQELGVLHYSQFKVEVTARNYVPQVRKQIENMGLKTQYVGDTVSQINQIFTIFKIILAAFGFVTLTVAVLGMFNTLTISLLERIKEIALMKMLGMRKRDINRIFLTESIILGIFGGILGLGLGFAAGQMANLLLNYYASNMGGQAVEVFYTPAIYIVDAVGLSFAIGFLTGIYPARRAVRVKALDVMRHE